MDRDGTKAGFNLEMTRAIAEAVDIPVIASGGVGTLGSPGGWCTSRGRLSRARRIGFSFWRLYNR